MDDQIIYSRIDDELAAGIVDRELLDQAAARHPNDPKKARKDYIEARFQKLRDANEEEEWGWSKSSVPKPPRPAPTGLALVLTGFAMMMGGFVLQFRRGETGLMPSLLIGGGALLARLYHRKHAAEHQTVQPELPERPTDESIIPFAKGTSSSGPNRVIRCVACDDFMRVNVELNAVIRCPNCGVKQMPSRGESS